MGSERSSLKGATSMRFDWAAFRACRRTAARARLSYALMLSGAAAGVGCSGEESAATQVSDDAAVDSEAALADTDVADSLPDVAADTSDIGSSQPSAELAFVHAAPQRGAIYLCLLFFKSGDFSSPLTTFGPIGRSPLPSEKSDAGSTPPPIPFGDALVSAVPPPLADGLEGGTVAVAAVIDSADDCKTAWPQAQKRAADWAVIGEKLKRPYSLVVARSGCSAIDAGTCGADVDRMVVSKSVPAPSTKASFIRVLHAASADGLSSFIPRFQPLDAGGMPNGKPTLLADAPLTFGQLTAWRDIATPPSLDEAGQIELQASSGCAGACPAYPLRVPFMEAERWGGSTSTTRWTIVVTGASPAPAIAIPGR